MTLGVKVDSFPSRAVTIQPDDLLYQGEEITMLLSETSNTKGTMTAKERDRLWDLYTITNKMGGRADYTAISPVAMMKYKEALGKVSTVISLIITGEDDERCHRYINELDALSRWNFGDRNGRISEEEKKVNARIKQAMSGWTPMNDY